MKMPFDFGEYSERNPYLCSLKGLIDSTFDESSISISPKKGLTTTLATTHPPNEWGKRDFPIHSRRNYSFKNSNKHKYYSTIISVGDYIKVSNLLENEFQLQYQDNAANHSERE